MLTGQAETLEGLADQSIDRAAELKREARECTRKAIALAPWIVETK